MLYPLPHIFFLSHKDLIVEYNSQNVAFMILRSFIHGLKSGFHVIETIMEISMIELTCFERFRRDFEVAFERDAACVWLSESHKLVYYL